jgi:succinate dehydrogenase / fumarate reductase flavoprotein subunit
MCQDALHREESCGGHFRTEHQTKEGEAQRDDEDFCYVAGWEYKEGTKSKLHKEDLKFKDVQLSQRSYK